MLGSRRCAISTSYVRFPLVDSRESSRLTSRRCLQVSGLPKNTSTWCNPSVSSDPSLAKLQHRPGAVGQWWRAEALGSNVTSDAARQSSLTGDGEDARAKLSAKALKVRPSIPSCSVDGGLTFCSAILYSSRSLERSKSSGRRANRRRRPTSSPLPSHRPIRPLFDRAVFARQNCESRRHHDWVDSRMALTQDVFPSGTPTME